MLEHMMMLVLQLGVIIFAAHSGGLLFKRFRMPSVLGEILAGALIGPYALGSLVLPGLPEGLFPRPEVFPISVGLYGFTTIASVLLLFLVGLKTNLRLFLQYSVPGTVVGVGGALVSFVLGDLAVVLCSKYVFGVSYGFADPVPLFLGVISTATSVSVTARILTDRKKVDSPEGVTILSGAVIDDVLGIILLAIVIGVARSGTIEWARVGGVAFRSVAIWLGCTALGLAFARQIAGALKKSRDAATMAVLSLGLALIVAGLFEQVGLAMIIGAYIMGLSLSRTDLANVIQDQLSSLYRFFVPIFFCVMGMLVNFQEMGSTRVLVFGFIYTGVAVGAKLAGCSLPSLFLNFNGRGALRVGLGMLPRGEVTLIIAGVGLSNGIIQDESFGVVMMMTFLTTLAAPYALDLALRSKLPALRTMPEEKRESRHLEITMPSRETTELVLRNISDSFTTEGFYVHLFDMDERIYQIRKGDTIISMKVSPSQIEFDCDPSQAAFINTLVYEVLADLERTMRELQSFADREKIGRQILDASASDGKEKPQLSSGMNPFSVEYRLQGKTKSEIIREMVEILARAGDIEAERKEQALADLLERERIMSTGMQDGIALPHTKTDAVDRLVCGVGLHPEGVDFHSLDQKPSRIFVMVLAPKDNPGAYLQFMASVSRVLSDKARRARILGAKSNRDLYMALTS